TAVLDQAVALPGAPVLLAALGDGLGARPADLRAGSGLEPGQLLGAARVRLDLGPHPEGGVTLGTPAEWTAEELFGLRAAGEPCHVGGGDVDERAASRGLVESERAEEVGLERIVDGWVERDGCRRVDHEIDVVADGDRSSGEVRGQGADLGGGELPEGLHSPDPFGRRLERRSAEHGPEAGRGVTADEKVDTL